MEMTPAAQLVHADHGGYLHSFHLLAFGTYFSSGAGGSPNAVVDVAEKVGDGARVRLKQDCSM